jgi:hypothetical protein
MLITLAMAQDHVKVTDPAYDAELTRAIADASAIVIDYLGAGADPTWDDTTAPPLVQRGTLITLGHYWEHRGDDAAGDHDPKLWTALSLLFMRTRYPALA